MNQVFGINGLRRFKLRHNAWRTNENGHDMYRGIIISKIDNRGRITLPPTLRDLIVKTLMDNRVIITNSIPFETNDNTFYSGLSLFSYQEWENIKIHIKSESFLENQFNSVKITILDPATELIIDKKGRIQIPVLLRKCSNLDHKQEVVFVHGINRFDLWSKDVWEIIEPIMKTNGVFFSNDFSD